MSARRQYPGVDRFRLAAALLVVCIHTAPLSSYSEPWDFALRTLARVAVPFFFTATGFFLFAGRIAPGPRPAGLSPAVRRFCAKTGALYAAATLLYLPVSLYGGKLNGLSFGALARDIVLDGTFYHLWYLPAAILGALLADGLLRLPGRWTAGCVCAALYGLGLLGDSWYGGGQALPALRPFFRALFLHMDYTRNGLFFAPLFLWLGAALRELPRPRPRACLAGLAGSLALLLAEAFGLRALGWPRHDSMYLALVPCAYFLFACLTLPRGAATPFLRECSMLVYVLHPMAIVLVRGAAKLLRAQKWLVENSLVHFLAVAALSFAGAAALAMLAERSRAKRPPRRQGAAETARAWARIDLDVVARNARALRGCLPEGCRLMAVVKADAYGHGAPAVAGRLWREGVRAFAVATVEEGAALRRCGVTGEILVLGYTAPARVPELLRWRLSQTVADAAHGAALAAAAGRRAVPVHIAVDTGMHRLGVPAENARAAARLLQTPGLSVRGLFTHLAVSDSLAPEDEAFTRAQLSAFSALVRRLRGMGLTPPPLHALASYGILNYAGLPLRYARAGIALYGALSAPGDETRLAPALAPALTLCARVVSVRALAEGACAGYGRAFFAARPTRLAVVSIGYADGVPRALGEGRGPALLRGARVPIVGRVCMDQLFVDATETGAAVDDVVTLIGADGSARVTAEEAAGAAGTIANELLSRVGARVPRVYVESDIG